jgi:hypothetical protein
LSLFKNRWMRLRISLACSGDHYGISNYYHLSPHIRAHVLCAPPHARYVFLITCSAIHFLLITTIFSCIYARMNYAPPSRTRYIFLSARTCANVCIKFPTRKNDVYFDKRCKPVSYEKCRNICKPSNQQRANRSSKCV